MSYIFFDETAAPQPALKWTRAQLMDIQGNLMIWCPSLAPKFVNGVDPRTGIREFASDWSAPHGIWAGWIWSLWIQFYPPDLRQIIYDAIVAEGFTHVAIQVCQQFPDSGYHGLRPITQAECDGWGALMMTIYDELRARDLMPICAGVAPGAPLAPGFDGARVQIAMTDWDNSTQADCRIKAIAEAFPNALLYYELPSGDEMSGWIIFPDADSCSSVTPTSTNGGAWIRSVQQKYPGFTGVLYETVQPEGHAANVEQLTKLNGWWRDVQQVLFETDTYWIFWHNLDHDERRAANDALLASCPWLHGYMSGGTSHPRIPDHQTDPSTIDAQGMDMIDIHAAAVVESPDFRSWPITTHISRVILSLTGVRVDFDKKDGPDRWPDNVTPGWDGPLQYSLGMAMLIDGRWYVDAPIEVWHGLEESGGSIQNQEVTNPQFPDLKGQIQCNWFYSPQRWGPMAGHRPQPGEQIGLFVVAGDCRSHFNPIQERSNIVLLPLPNTRVAADFDVTT